jgi:hypothetical protein
LQGYVRGVYVSAKISDASGYAMIGLSTNPSADAGINQIDYAISFYGGTVRIFESGTDTGGYGGYSSGQILYVIYDGVNVRYYNNGTLLRTVARSIGSPLYLDSTIYTPSLSFNNVSFGPMGESGLSGSSGSSGTSGANGSSGTSGSSGNTGSPGSNGSSGSSGTSGNTGSPGSNGSSGTSGSSGNTGSPGSNGSSGSSGTSGNTGSPGSNGSSGSSGTSGNTGSPGSNGSSGTSGTSVSVSGTTNYVVKFTSATTIGNTGAPVYDDGTNVGIGTTSPGTKFHLLGNSFLEGNTVVNNATFANSTVYSLEVNGGILVKNTGKTGLLTIYNTDPLSGGDNAYVVFSVGGSSSTSYAKIQGYYGAGTVGSTPLYLNPASSIK